MLGRERRKQEVTTNERGVPDEIILKLDSGGSCITLWI